MLSIKEEGNRFYIIKMLYTKQLSRNPKGGGRIYAHYIAKKIKRKNQEERL